METISAKKFVGSFFQLMPWVKNIRFIIGLVIILLVGLTIYKAFFKETRHTRIVAEKVNYYEEKKRAWWVPTPFVEIFGELKTDEDSPQVGTRFGARWEF